MSIDSESVGGASLHNSVYTNADAHSTDVSRILEALEKGSGPNSISLSLGLLIDAGRIAEAAGLAHKHELQPEWAERAIEAFFRNGEDAEAGKVLNWAQNQEDRIVELSCASAFVCETLKRERIVDGKRPAVLPGAVGSKQRNEIERMLDVLSPGISWIRRKGQIENKLEERCAAQALVCAWLVGRRQESEELGTLLRRRVPIPLESGYVTLYGGIIPDRRLPNRLRSEYIDSFEAHFLAAGLELDVFGEARVALDHGKALWPNAKNREEMQRLGGLLITAAARLGSSALEEIAFIASLFSYDNEPLVSYYEATKLLVNNMLDQASNVLADVKDQENPLWLQYKAQELLQRKKPEEALDLLLRAAEKSRHPILFKETAKLALACGRFSVARDALTQRLAVTPDDDEAIEMLAHVHERRREFPAAAAQYKKLAGLHPDKPEYVVRRGYYLELAGETEEARAAFARIQGNPSAEPIATLALADLLGKAGRVQEGFEALERIWEAHKELPEVAFAYMSAAYRANHDEKGQEGLLQLLKLQKEGKLPKNALQQVGVSEAVQMILENRERRERLLEDVLRGRIPWLWADIQYNMSYYWAWRMRTQPLSWTKEIPTLVAEYRVYATNGFEIRLAGKDRVIESIDTDVSGRRAVFDLTSLITLHRLGLLSRVAGCFEAIYLPTGYSILQLDESERLLPHQPSRLKGAEALEAAITSERIHVMVDDLPGGIRCLDEYREGKDGKPEYRIRDLISVLENSGKVSGAVLDDLRKVESFPEEEKADTLKLERGATLLAAASTLQTLYDLDALDATLEEFDVLMSREDRDEVIGTVRAFRAQDEVRTWHEELWNTVRTNKVFMFEAADPVLPDKERDTGREYVPLLSGKLASDKGLPYVSDDRKLQMVHISEGNNAGKHHLAFDTSHLLIAMEKAGKLGLEELASAFAQLIEWRYVFLVPPAKVLKRWADDFRHNPPGQTLQMVATYVHGCMRDPALIRETLDTKPKSTFANRLYQTWCHEVGVFLAILWQDKEFSDDAAGRLTRWAVDELLPSVTRDMGPWGVLVAETTVSATLAGYLLETKSSHDPDRVKMGLKAVQSAFELTDEAYGEAIEEIIGYV